MNVSTRPSATPEQRERSRAAWAALVYGAGQCADLPADEETRMDDDTLAYAMRRLVGLFATPSYLKAEALQLEERGLMEFHEWPSGHWSLTERGRNFLAEHGGGA